MPALGALLGDRSVGAVTIGQALHWMNHDELFGALAPLAQRDGGVTVVTNGTPLSLQDSTWSRALRGVLEAWSGTKTTGTLRHGRAEPAALPRSADRSGIRRAHCRRRLHRRAELRSDRRRPLLSVADHQLPAPDQRPLFAERARRALAPGEQFTEHVHVVMRLGRVR
jgi:hypothetical protein